ncbi:MAG: hypothetical protein ABIA66_03800 [Candidatus Omnitrophota bacterium]
MHILSVINIIILGIDIAILTFLFLFSIIEGIPLLHTYKSFDLTIPLETQIAIIGGPFICIFSACILISKERLKKKVLTIVLNLAIPIAIIIAASFYLKTIYLPMAQFEAESEYEFEEGMEGEFE